MDQPSTGVCLFCLSNFLWKLYLIFNLSNIDLCGIQQVGFFGFDIRILKMFRKKKHKNQFNVSFARLIFIKTFSISWFDTHKDFSPEELIRLIIPDHFFRKPNGPPNDGFVLCLHSLWTIIGQFNLSFWQVCYVWKLLAASDYVIAIICHYLFVFKTEKS